MHRHLVVMGLLLTSLFWLTAGCPQPAPTASQTPWSGQINGGGTGGGGGTIGPAASDSNSDATSSTTDSSATAPDPVPAVVGGDVSSTTPTADELTVTYPDCQAPGEGAYWRSEILRLVNQQRQAQGAEPVTWNDTLAMQADDYACQMIQYKFFGHVNTTTGSTLTERAGEFGYAYWIIGENLAAGQRSPAQVMADWMDSPCHRENIMNPAFTELGVGVRVGGDYGFYWVQEFGRPYSLDPYPGPRYTDPACTREQ